MNIKLVTVGKLQPIFLQAQEEFRKRLSRFCKLEIIEVPDRQAPEHLSEADKVSVMLNESELLLKKIENNEFIIALDSTGIALSSIELSEKLQSLQNAGNSNITFIIGGSLGLHPMVLKRASYILSLSRMTFTHSLARIVLIEQLYRSFKINSNQPYHK